MSYDLAIYGRRAASPDELRDLITQGSGLRIDNVTDRTLTVVRGARQRYSFTIAGPDYVEIEDIPEVVATALLRAKFLYSVVVEGSTATEIVHATRFARRLAEALDGAVLDQQTDGLWSRSQSKKVQKPGREERVATLSVAWYCLREQLRPDAAAIFIRAAQQVLPEALPCRFGEYEPFQGKLADAGPEGFIDAWNAATSTLFISGSGPCIGGDLSAGANAQFQDPHWSMSLDFLADPMRTSGWRETLCALFVKLADELPAFYASAEITPGHVWSGRSLWVDSETVFPISPVRSREGWTGLPPRATWLTWLGEPFTVYYPLLPTERTTQTVRGALYEAAEEPGEPDSLVPLSKWLPADLFASLAPNPLRQQPVPLVRATTVPSGLN